MKRLKKREIKPAQYLVQITFRTLLLLASLAVFVCASFAWYGDIRSTYLNRIDGAVAYSARYFESGNGSTIDQIVSGYNGDDPILNGGFTLDDHAAWDTDAAYEIKTPDQFYNFAWLQYMGYFNRPTEGTTNIPTTYFYLSADLDMTGYILPPAGTTENPFICNFDGNGHTISNLTVTNTAKGNSALDELPKMVAEDIGTGDVDGVEIVGLFGVVGKTADDSAPAGSITVGSNVYTYASSANRVHDLTISGITIETQTSNSLAGIAVGFVNAEVSGVKVDSGEIINDGATALTAISSNLSDYALVGAVTEPYKETLNVCAVTHEVDVVTGTYETTEAGNAWGGSIAMNDLYDRLSGIYDDAETVQYVSRETRTGTGTVTNTTMANSPFLVKEWDGTGQYSFSTHRNGTKQYLYLYGEDTIEATKTVTINSTETFEGVKLSNNGYYLNATTSGITNNGQDEASATCWVIDTQNHRVYTILDDGTRYYLRYYNNTLSINTSTNYATWYMRNGALCYNNDADTTLYCNNGVWTVGEQTEIQYFTIRDTSNRYLMNTGSTYTVTAETNPANPTVWGYDGTKIFVASNSQRVLMYYSGTYPVIANAGGGTNYYVPTSSDFSSTVKLRYGNNRYIRYNNGWTSTTTQSQGANFWLEAADGYETPDYTMTQTVGTGSYEQTTTTTETSEYGTIPTFFPLTVTNSGTTATGNTGYIASGADYKTTNSSYPNYQAGDIRVSYYANNKLARSLDGTVTGTGNNASTTATYAANKLEILTNVGGTTYRVSDSYNASNNNVHRDISGYEKRTVAQLGLEKYNTARTQLNTILANSAPNIFGLHFMDAAIDISKLVTVPSAIVNGDPYTNLQVPENSIDFTLKQVGRINFFAGTYFPGNTAFFSLHQ
ncbi:MAG: hypothetical protein IKN53_05985, partial [Oscillibacter sp.]|nr:hypothetical protein [Oscillibacter sp.]